MTEFTTSIKAFPAYDYRDEPYSPTSKGASGVRLYFSLVGPLGAISWELLTGWMSNAIEDTNWSVYAGRPPHRTGSPGVDAIGFRQRQPTVGPVASHSLTKIKDYWGGPAECSLLGGECYGDVGYLAGDQIFLALTEGGSEGAFAKLQEFYDSWLGPEEDP